MPFFQASNAEDRAWVTHTHIVLEQLDAVLSNLVDAETGQRGYIITGEVSYLEPYNDSRAHVNQNLAELRALTADNTNQQRALDLLEPATATTLSTLQERIEIRDREGMVAAVELVRTGTAKLHMDKMRTLIAGMRLEENRLLKSRSEEADASLRKTRIVIVVGEILGFAF